MEKSTQTFTTKIMSLLQPKKPGFKRIFWKNSKIIALCALVIALSFSIRFLFLITPSIEKVLLPKIIDSWPKDEGIIISNDKGLTTQSGKAFIINKAIMVDPTIDEISLKDFEAQKSPMVVTRLYVFNRDRNGSIKVFPIQNLSQSLASPLVINTATITDTAQTLIANKENIALALFGVIFIFYLFDLSISLFIVSLLIGTLAFLISRLLQKNTRQISWKESFVVSYELSTIGVIVSSLIATVLFPISGIISLITALLVLYWLFKKDPVTE